MSPVLLHAVPTPARAPVAAPGGWDSTIDRRRSPASGRRKLAPWTPGPWFGLALDAVDYGIGLLHEGGALLYANAALGAMLQTGRALRLDPAGHLRAAAAIDEMRLAEARHAACSRGLRRLVQIGEPASTLALVGIDDAGPGAEKPCLILASRVLPCERLSLELYAKLHGLTQTEAQVLVLLSEGFSPDEIAELHAVRISTVRTQIGSIRAKTDEPSLRKLMQRLATLPPIVRALRGGHALAWLPLGPLAAAAS